MFRFYQSSVSKFRISKTLSILDEFSSHNHTICHTRQKLQPGSTQLVRRSRGWCNRWAVSASNRIQESSAPTALDGPLELTTLGEKGRFDLTRCHPLVFGLYHQNKVLMVPINPALPQCLRANHPNRRARTRAGQVRFVSSYPPLSWLPCWLSQNRAKVSSETASNLAHGRF